MEKWEKQVLGNFRFIMILLYSTVKVSLNLTFGPNIHPE